MDEAQLISDLQTIEAFENNIKTELNETSYSRYRDFLTSFITDYNNLMQNEKLKPFILKNRPLALRARKALEESQNFLINYCQSIKVIPPERKAILPVPEISQEKQNEAIQTWNHVASLLPVFKGTEELCKAIEQGYKPPAQTKYRFDEWLDKFNTNAKLLENTLTDPELEDLRTQNQEQVNSAIKVMRMVSFWINELIANGVPCSAQKMNEFNQIQEKLAA
ncbi:hypothetical protein KY309_01450 [Candidatus Woesearchaeota archaeon]|nr:hypothetical protein [Candidatus Woesearchaeota archaeon]MBW3016256.1 hypothetical protein [Candidatus Woesearchaeota archaeon]